MISAEEAAQVERQKYVLAHGVKEGLVEKVTDWPGVHAASKAVRQELYEAYGRFVAAFREASEKLRSGNRMASFPAGSFPSALPFVAG